jgi:hypothetical protein
MPFDIGGFIYNSQHADVQEYKSIVRTGLVLHLDASALESYPGSGTSWFNISGNINNGTLVNSPTYSSNNGGDISLNGSNQCVELGTFFTYNSFTISLWVSAAGTQNQYADIFDNNHTGTRNMVCQQNSNNLNQYAFDVIGSSTSSSTGFFTLSTNTWTHLSFTFDGSVVRGYLNGSMFATGGSCTPNWSSQYLRLGQWGGGGRNWNGKYGNFMIYDRPLTATEILQNYNIQKGRFGL